MGKDPDQVRVSVNLSRTFRLADYESLKVDCGFESHLEEGELPEEGFMRARLIVEGQLNYWTKMVKDRFGINPK